MEVYVARQPIFDREMKVYGYELFYRKSDKRNFFEGIDDNQATAELINNSYLVMQFNDLTSGGKAFINFSKDLLEKQIPQLLPKEHIVVEVLERVEPTTTVVRACKILKNEGYILALDDFVFREDYLPLIRLADIIKVEFTEVDFEEQKKLINKYKPKIKFLAERIETREQHELAMDMGYDYFQGYFFSKPVIVKSNEIESINANLVEIMNELKKEHPDLQKIAEIIERDLALSYKLLKIANSVFFGAKNEIYSIKNALVRLGVKEINNWIYLMMLKEIQNKDNAELVKNSLIRGKMMELISLEIGKKTKHFEFFMTGIFSSIDTLLNKNMEQIVEELALTEEVKHALLGNENELFKTLDKILSYEMVNWAKFENKEVVPGLSMERFMVLYIEALQWVMELEF